MRKIEQQEYIRRDREHEGNNINRDQPAQSNMNTTLQLLVDQQTTWDPAPSPPSPRSVLAEP